MIIDVRYQRVCDGYTFNSYGSQEGEVWSWREGTFIRSKFRKKISQISNFEFTNVTLSNFLFYFYTPMNIPFSMFFPNTKK